MECGGLPPLLKLEQAIHSYSIYLLAVITLTKYHCEIFQGTITFPLEA